MSAGSARTAVVALVHEVFPDARSADGLRRRLAEAARRGARLALLPELPLDRWAPADREPRDEDAEDAGGPRHARQAAAAREAGVGLVGGAIVRERDGGRRHNTALVFDSRGNLAGSYRKLHLPDEEGFWETRHYEAGGDPPEIIEVGGLRLGVQICSDVNRPALSQVLGARGVELIAAPRSTPRESYERWKLVLRANAVTSCAYVISVNRPAPEAGVPLGGPSIAIAPDGSVLLETEDPLTTITLDRDALSRARKEYPGYLQVRAALYSRAWNDVS